jgi:hypothetical protein
VHVKDERIAVHGHYDVANADARSLGGAARFNL